MLGYFYRAAGVTKHSSCILVRKYLVCDFGREPLASRGCEGRSTVLIRSFFPTSHQQIRSSVSVPWLA